MKKNKVRLLHFTSSLKMGGAETVLCDLIEGLGDTDFEHHVIFLHDGLHKVRLQKMGIALYHLSGFYTIYDLGLLIKLHRLLKILKPDCLHSLLWAANNVARLVAPLLNIPVISVVHNNVDQDGWLRNNIDRLTIGRAAYTVAVSDEVKDSLMMRDRNFSGAVKVIRNGIDVPTVLNKITAQQVSRASLGLLDEHFVIGSVGRFEAVKNYHLLIRAVALLWKKEPTVRLVLIGSGSHEQPLRELARELSIAHTVIFVVGKQAYGYYPLFDLFVQSSNKEGISIALLEAMSALVPCVVTSMSPDHPVIEHGLTGLIVPAGDCPGLVAAVGRLVADRLLGARLGLEGNRQVNERMGLGTTVAAYRELFLKSINRK